MSNIKVCNDIYDLKPIKIYLQQSVICDKFGNDNEDFH